MIVTVVPGEVTKVENGVHVPSVVMSVLLRQDGYLQNLQVREHSTLRVLEDQTTLY